MKKTLRAAGAAGLASATLVTGLFGGAGAAQAAPTSDAVASDDARVIGPMANQYRSHINHAARGLTATNTDAHGSKDSKLLLVRPCNGSKSQQFRWVEPGTTVMPLSAR